MKFVPIRPAARAAVLLCAALLAGTAVVIPSRVVAQGAAPAAEDDPSEVFLKAFTAFQQGDKLEKEGKFKAALAKHRFGASLLDQLARTNPNWNPIIVQYRAKKLSEAISRMESRVAAEGGGSAAPTEADEPVAPPLAPVGRPRNPPPAAAPPPSAPVSEPPRSEMRYPRPGAAFDPGADGQDPLPSADGRPGASRRIGAPPTLPSPGALRSGAAEGASAKADRIARELDETRKLLAAVKEERDKLDQQLQANRAELRTAQRKSERAATENKDLEAQLARSQETLKEALARNPDAAETRKKLREQVTELKKQIAEAEERNKGTAKDRDEAAKKLAEATQRVESLAAERDAAVARAEGTKDAADRIDALLASNADLQKRLDAAEISVRMISDEAAAKKKEAERLRAEIVTLRDQLAASKDQGDRGSTTVTELRAELERVNKELAEVRAQGATSEEVQKKERENTLLRDIVLRQLKDQARREESRRLAQAELDRLGVQSSVLSQQIALLGQPTVRLSDEERALFRDTPIAASSSTDTKIEAVIGAVRQPGAKPADEPVLDGATAANPGAAPEPPIVETTAPQPKVPDDLIPVAREAKEQIDSGKFAEAEKSCRRILARDPQNVFALSNLGVVYMRQNQLKKAEVELRKAVSAAPNDSFAHASLGLVFYRLRKLDESIVHLTRALAIDPKNATAHNHLGIVSGQKGWMEAAEKEFKAAVALNPRYADAHFNLAVVYATNRPPSKQLADTHYRRATALGASPDAELEKLIRN